ncbi:MAG: cheBR, two-component system, chemotaxis family, CheB/CheR fusion protein [Schlesneria sp.]|nr:cheBR, two-component system, chemotaxis family, CheB/CheR fusion protein [Schlesneria sp.]
MSVLDPSPQINEGHPLDDSTMEFPVIGVGASAGGLEAFSELLRSLPPAPGLVFVLIQHLDPNHPSLLSEILARETSLKVVQATEGMPVEPDHVYVIPPNCALTISDYQLHLSPRGLSDGLFMPIDLFFRSLAQHCGRMAVAVVLSGGGTDGALGLQEIKAVGGVTIVQDERSARHSAMPRSADATGCADFVLPPDQIARELIRLKDHGAFLPISDREREQEQDEIITFPKIFHLLRQRTGADFTHYKRPTIRRRIARRMALCAIDRIEDYVTLLQQRPDEQYALYQDFLIRVTRFFRDPTTFDVLQSTVFPNLLRNRSVENPIRIWVAGCSTGEEVYSIAIALLEIMGDMINTMPVKILATDINEAALEKARAGTYIDNIALDVSPDRLRRFFNQTNSHYQISKSVRDLCVFSTHNITRDTPFAGLDLISCRNLLIYLDLPLQKRVLPYFHYALKPGGYLMLGTSETVGSSANLFEVVDKESRVYCKKFSSTRVPIEFPVSD